MDTIRQGSSADLYPRHALFGAETALVVFAAGFHGAQDALWIADAGMTATCLDIDAEKLEQMQRVYPAGWEFVETDSFEYATNTNRRWDVVSVDCPSQLFDVCAALVPLWCHLAARAVILGTGEDTRVEVPDGWKVTDVRRRSSFQGGVYWTVLEREPV